jgi:putative ABC transport system permease protein
MTATTVSLAISAISDTLIDTYKDGFGVETEIVPDWENSDKYSKTVKTENPDGSTSEVTSFEDIKIPLTQYVDFANSPYVMDTLFSATAPYASDTLQSVAANNTYLAGGTLEELLELYQRETREELLLLFGGGSYAEEHLESLLDAKPNAIGTIFAYSDASLMKDFRRNEKRLSEGRLFEGTGEVLISKELAEKNGIKLGDIITVSGNSKTYDINTIDLTVVGIFEDLKGEVNQMGKMEITAKKDDLIVSFDTLYSGSFYRAATGTMTYYLTNPEAPAPFLQEMREKGLHEMFTLDYDVASYNAIVEPVKDMSGVAATFGIVIFITGAAILIFLSVINIRERKYEVGVLRAIGMKKHQVARGMIYESLSLVTVCTLIGLPLGGLLAKPIAGLLLGNSENTDIAVPFGMALLPLILLVAVILGMISSLIGILYITQYEPMKILQERN